MYIEASKGPFCQSCGMPMHRASDFGTGADRKHINDYCRFCFNAGKFIEPGMTPQAMIDKCVTFMTGQTFMPEHEVRRLMKDVIPRLKRWRPDSVGQACSLTHDRPELSSELRR